jgi:hypothetical protein
VQANNSIPFHRVAEHVVSTPFLVPASIETLEKTLNTAKLSLGISHVLDARLAVVYYRLWANTLRALAIWVSCTVYASRLDALESVIDAMAIKIR